MNYKTELVEKRYELLHPIVKELLSTADKWSIEYDGANGVEEPQGITLTETVTTPEEDKALKRESPAHSQARAADIRVKDWSPQKITAFQKFFNTKYLYLGYIRKKAGTRILMYLHGEGDNIHIHMAIGLDVIEKYSHTYKGWNFPVHKKPAGRPAGKKENA